MAPNEGLAHLSDHLFFVAVVCYALSMIGYAAEFAFGQKAAAAAALVRSSAVETASRVLVGAGGPPVTVDGLPAGPPVVSTRAQRRESSRAEGRGSIPGTIALTLTIIGWVAHIGSITSRGLAAHRVPWGNMYEFSSMVCLMAVTIFLFLLARYEVRYLGAFLMVPIVLYMGLAGTVLYAPAGPLVPALNDYWLKIHVVAAMGSSAIFMVGGVVTMLYLVKQRWERLTAAGQRPTWASLGSLLPASVGLDRLAYRTIAFAFPLWTFAITAGAIWAEAAWGRYWGWDPKETWSFITWVVYAGYLHARATAGWRGRRAALIALVGFACLLVDYYVVNIWITGLHSYAGLG